MNPEQAGVYSPARNYFWGRGEYEPPTRHAPETGVAGHHENVRIFEPLNHDLPVARTVFCFQRTTIEEVANMLQLAEIQEFKAVAPANHVALSIVHDLRNPLSAISGCAELLASATLDAEQTKRIATNVWRASERMKSLLSEFVAAAREEKEHRELCNLRAVLAASRDAADVSLRADIDVTIDVSPEIDLRMDCRRMQSVFWNLIVNAMEAMPRGGAIHIKASAVSNRVRITIEDTGPGLPAMLRDRLFEPFTTAGKAGGVGLGLAISRETVRSHGGDLWSEPARGARFVMCCRATRDRAGKRSRSEEHHR